MSLISTHPPLEVRINALQQAQTSVRQGRPEQIAKSDFSARSDRSTD